MTVPDVVGKDRFEAERILAAADLNFRVRATRPSKANPDTVLFQLPRPGEVVKAGQTVAMDISRVMKEGELPETVKPAEEDNRNANASVNSNTNENKPKKPKNKNENENANGNANSNTNKPANANRTPNANRVNANTPSENANVTPRANENRPETPTPRVSPTPIENRRPVVPKPTPTAPNSNRLPRQ